MKTRLSVRSWIARKRSPKLQAAALLASAILLASVHPSVYSQEEYPDIASVEEDWELVLDEPSGAKDSPQLVTVMSPYDHLEGLYGMVTWNYREMPNFAAGGLQLQSWAGDTFLYSKNFNESEFSTTGETITWTQSLKIKNQLLTLQVKNGQSTTWGDFGGSELQLSEQVWAQNLNGYSPVKSATNSAITFGSYRVISLRIKQVRYYDADGHQISLDNIPRVIHQRPIN